MSMTHYMELLAVNQPWNLIIYMAIPVILAETLAITELYILLKKDVKSWVIKLNKISGILSGVVFLGIIINLFTNAVIPISANGEWRGVGDIIAVFSYLLAGCALVGVAMLELGIIGRNKVVENKMKTHVFLVSAFLVLAHVAMIFGMVNPEIFGYKDSNGGVMNDEMNVMK